MTYISIVGSLFLLGLVTVVIVVVIILVTNATRDKQGPREASAPKTVENESYQYQAAGPLDKRSQNTIIAFVVVFLMIFIGGIYFTVQINDLKSKVKSLDNQLSSVNQSLWQSQNSISILSQQLEELEQQDDYVERVTYEFTTLTEAGDGVVDLAIYMKQMPILGEVSLVIEDQEGNVNTLVLTSETLIIQTTLTLDFSKVYDFYVVVEDEDLTKSEQVLHLEMQYLLQGLKDISLKEHYVQDGFEFDFTIYNNYSLHESLAFKEVWIELYDGETLVSTRLLTIPSKDVNQLQEFEFTVFTEEPKEAFFMIKVTGVDYFGHEYVMFHEGW